MPGTFLELGRRLSGSTTRAAVSLLLCLFWLRSQPPSAVCACAARSNITHRDLKLENLLLQRPASEHEPPAVKIADFGLAKKMAEQSMQTICGTPQYVAPEVILVRGLPRKALQSIACIPGIPQISACSVKAAHRLLAPQERCHGCRCPAMHGVSAPSLR